MRPLTRPLPAHSIRWRALLQMRQNGLDRVRIGDICDHPQRAAGTGYVLVSPAPELIDDDAALVERVRYKVRERLRSVVQKSSIGTNLWAILPQNLSFPTFCNVDNPCFLALFGHLPDCPRKLPVITVFILRLS